MNAPCVVADLVRRIQPVYVVELGTGDGFTAAAVMEVLPPGSRLVTINWPNPPSGDNPLHFLGEWIDDPRLSLVRGDTRDPEVATCVTYGVDLLYIDSTHTYECALAEWKLYQPKLVNHATVVVDDLDHNDMGRFWDILPYYKYRVNNDRVGIFTYRSDRND